MYCEYPSQVGKMLVRCQKCDTCRASRVSLWANRMLLEAGEWEDNAFVTLTYNDQSLPPGGDLSPEDLRNFNKRLRKAFVGRRLRFFAVGEYGERFGRPHYHGIWFNLPSCYNGVTLNNREWQKGGVCCPACSAVQRAWSLSGNPIGGVRLGTVEEASCRYVAGYVLKGATRTDDPRLGGRWPEFARMSNRPGIGYTALHDIASAWLMYRDGNADVDTMIMRGRKRMPLGRYLTSKLRLMCDVDAEVAAQAIIEKNASELQAMREVASKNEKSWRAVYSELHAQEILNWKSRQKLKHRRAA